MPAKYGKGKSVSDSLAMLDFLTTTTLSRKGHLSIISLDFSKAFDKIGKYHKKKINNISWLKVPHHGSKHNMNSSIIKWLNPNIAYISTEKVGNYLNMCTVNALKHNNCVVYSTHKGGNKVYNLIVEREGYSTAESL